MSRLAGASAARPAHRGPNRRHKRFLTRHLLVERPVAGRVVNIGQLGLAVETTERLSVGRSYDFKVRLGSKRMRLPGQIRWCRLVGTHTSGGGDAVPVFQAGVSLAETVGGRAWRQALRRLTERTTRAADGAPSRPLVIRICR